MVFVACTCDEGYLLPPVRSAAATKPLAQTPYGGDINLRRLGKAVPVRKRGYTRTSDGNQWWGSSASSEYLGSKSSKSSSKGAKSGKAQPPTPVEQIIIYIPSPTKMPISQKPTISPKPTTEPTHSPTRDPSELPSMAPTHISSAAPSDFPFGMPSISPTGLESEEPSSIPSASPSYHPTLVPSEGPSSEPSNYPSQLPSMLPSVMPSSIPSLGPSQSPTAKPESFIFSNQPSSVGMKSPPPTSEDLKTPSPSIVGTDKPTKQAKTVKPTEESKSEDNLTASPDSSATTNPTPSPSSTEMPTTLSPLTTTRLPTISQSGVPTTDSSQSDVPTVDSTFVATGNIVDERQGLQMQLFGIETLTPSLIEVYQKETEAYIEDYYNDYTGSDSIRNSVSGVNATLVVTNWTEPDNPLVTGKRIFPRKIDDTDLKAEDKAKLIVLDVTEPCTGEAPLTVTFVLELQYHVDDNKLNHRDVVISHPFLTVESRSEYIADYLQSEDDFSNLYCSSQIIFPEDMTLSPTVTTSPSIAPSDRVTSEDIVSDERDDLKMLLYGIDLLTPDRIEVYERETAAYMEDFYNNYTSGNGIRGQVYDVNATVTVTDWSQPTNPLTGAKRMFRNRKVGQTELTAEDKAKVIVLDISEPCTGEFPLMVTFTLELEYRVDDPALDQSDLIISAPFRTVDSRTVYIRDYLQSENYFNELYCSSRIVFDDQRSPVPTTFGTPVFPGGMTPSPSALNVSATPTITGVPTMNGTDSLMPTSDNETTIFPTSNGSISTAPSSSMMPSLNTTISPSPSLVPTSLDSTLSPTLANQTAENATVAPVPTPVLNASIVPTMMNGSIAPSVLNLSAAPSESPSIIDAGVNDTSLAPSISRNTTAPTMFVSQAPTATLPPWEMRLYGMTELVEPSQLVYDRRTVLYIEAFYNGNSTEGIRQNISNMEAIVEVVGQIPPETSRSYLKPRSSPTIHHEVRKHRSKKHSNEASFSFVPSKKHFDFAGRLLQEDPCSGPFLLLRMKITITYITFDTSLTAEDVLMEAFRTEEYRDDYLNNYLLFGEVGEQAFPDLSCTSELFETAPKSVNPTPAPMLSSLVPSIIANENDKSLAPSVSNITSDALSLVPTLSNETTVSPPANATLGSSAPTPTAGNLTATGTPTLVVVLNSSTPTLVSNITTPPPGNRETDDIFGDPTGGEIDDIFGDPLRLRSSQRFDRKCNNVDFDRSKTEEIAIKFIYGVESKSRQNFSVGSLEELILDFLTTSLLRCDESSLQANVQPRSNQEVTNFGVVRIRYPDSGDITSLSKCFLF